jgi:poly-gamma-glutamate synthesis protein (capsule biosynthesis protein)
MNNQTRSELSVVAAKTLVKHAPHDLPALQIFRRPKVGPTVRLCAVGDIGLSGRAAVTAKMRGSGALFADVAPVLRAADISFGNLESPLASEIAPDNMFAAPVTGAATLDQAGFNVLHLANNHVGEYGQAGLAATLAAVRKAGVIPLGAGDDLAAAQRLVRTDNNGLRIGWLGCGRTLLVQENTGAHYWEFDEHDLLSAIAQARPNVDVLIVSIHIGLMYMDYPRPEHKSMAERLMANGADLILMHHAHVLQGVQITSQGRVCCYNLGNFLYDWQEGNVQTPVMLREQNEGAIFWFEIDRKGIALVTALPTWIDDECRVGWATGERGYGSLSRLARISRELDGDFELAFERQRAERNTGPIFKVLAFHIKHRNWRQIIDSLRRTRFEHFKMVLRWLSGLCRASLVSHRADPSSANNSHKLRT